ncbi:LutC/YkgG family protein [Bauldia sp.]|uniref:LutC/YkgG family protein n=1 Tax=Bauldia sp. TaxID=2575872 RepID=UPI003BAB9385
MSDRDVVLGKIRRALSVDGGDVGRRAVVVARLENAPRGIVPERGQVTGEARIELFATMAEKVSATVTRVTDRVDIPRVVTEFLRDHNLPASLRMGDDPLLNDLPWSVTPIDISHGPSGGSDPVGISHAIAGVAETGTLVLTSGTDNPTTLNFLPETHVIVVRAEDIAGDYETIWDMMRERCGERELPRTVNFITGPSRSGDIEQKLLLGAHGPRRLHVVVVG